ncbi:MAG: hypothetical protein HQK55_13880, partial [Deltaproteobacteria bacterium]|nr:hypothetical protein [Deltaproteobacteria bacterium]
AASSLLGLINEILDFSKIESGDLQVGSTAFFLDDVLKIISDLTGAQAQEKGLDFSIIKGPDLPNGLIGDPARLDQVLKNLCANAVKFTDAGEISISVEMVERNQDTVKLRFAVKDTGVGLSAKQKSKLFSAFTQADGSSTRKYGGVGIGLTISKRLVEMMGGEIGLESEAGRGSTFFFTAVFGLHSQAKPEIGQGESLPTAKDFEPRKTGPAHKPAAVTTGSERKNDLDITDLNGIDAASGLKKFAGNQEQYQDRLMKFHAQYGKASARIKAALAQKERETALGLVGEVKDAAGEIGAKDLYAASEDLELVIKHPDQITHSHLKNFDHALQIVLSSLSVFFNQSGNASLPGLSGQAVNKEVLLSVLSELEVPMFERIPKRCMLILEQITALTWPAGFSGDLDLLEKMIKKYKFKEALPLLKSIQDRLREGG